MLLFYLKNKKLKMKNLNPLVYFEIPVNDLDRAVEFYSKVFGYEFERGDIHGNEMAFFPYGDGMPGATGALAKGEIYKPTKDGAVLYLKCDKIYDILKRVTELGSEILFPKTSVPTGGFVAEFEDSEGNRIAVLGD